jgi:SPP1 gp7 family putative phage head morphogenesis protein
MPSVNEALQDRAIQHALLLQQYGTGLADKLLRLLNSADAEIVEKLAARLAAIEERGFDIGPATTARLQQMREEVRAINRAIYDRLTVSLVDELVEFSSTEAEFQRKALVASIGADLSTVVPAPERLRAIVTETPMEGRLLASWAEGMEAGRAERINAAVRQGMLQGESTDTIVRRIRGTKAAQYSDGVLDISRRSAQSIVRTSVNHVSNVAAQATWKANDHLIKGWQYLATLDSRTTITCASLSGQVFPIGEGPIPPRHIRCRSLSVAVTKSFRELGVDKDELPPGKRASMDGQVAGDTTFAKWLTMKGTAMQDKILGPARAELWRSGKLDLDQFIRSDGTVLTLDQLRSKYPGLL